MGRGGRAKDAYGRILKVRKDSMSYVLEKRMRHKKFPECAVELNKIYKEKNLTYREKDCEPVLMLLEKGEKNIDRKTFERCKFCPWGK